MFMTDFLDLSFYSVLNRTIKNDDEIALSDFHRIPTVDHDHLGQGRKPGIFMRS